MLRSTIICRTGCIQTVCLLAKNCSLFRHVDCDVFMCSSRGGGEGEGRICQVSVHLPFDRDSAPVSFQREQRLSGDNDCSALSARQVHERVSRQNVLHVALRSPDRVHQIKSVACKKQNVARSSSSSSSASGIPPQDFTISLYYEPDSFLRDSLTQSPGLSANVT